MSGPVPEVLVFDMDGVLVDVSRSYREAIRRTVERFTGRLPSHDEIQALKNRGGMNNDWDLSFALIRQSGAAPSYEEVVEEFQRIFWGRDGDGLILEERWIPQPGLLERLAARRRLAIFTGRLRQEAEHTLRRFAQGIGFDPLVAHEDVERTKPAPDGLLRIAAAFPGRTLWYLGDSVDDARSARSASVPFVGIAPPGHPRREELARLLEAEGAMAVLASVNQLEELLG
ncbi:MAG: HAD hydrolase-like protein [Bryobacterales bacterium]|nr:HAD hydrolase-like protein [Bryobacteraceae bacterium]MDW8131167.1 HAD hydrolase-like protein [Bryobacterales bacterium]